MNETKQSAWPLVIGVCVVAILMTIPALNYLDMRKKYHAALPPDHVKTIDDFRAWRPDYTNTHRVIVGDVTWYFVDNPTSRQPGRHPNTYIFDRDGKYLRDTSLTADLRSYRFVHSAGSRITPINIAEVPNKRMEATRDTRSGDSDHE